MIKHYIARYEEDSVAYAEAWLQVNALGRCFCFLRRRVRLATEG